MRRGRFALIAAVLAVAGCKVEPPKPALVESVAVLLFDNESNDLNAPDILQSYVHRALLNSAYRPLDMDQVNEKLEKAGIRDGGQLAAVDPTKLGKDLGVQALLFGNVESFDYTNIGYYTSRKVTLQLKLVDVTTGDTLWESQGTGANRQLTLNSQEAKKNLAEGLAKQTIEKVAKAPLDEESRQATTAALRTLPGFRFCGFAGDPAAVAVGGRRVIRKTYKNN